MLVCGLQIAKTLNERISRFTQATLDGLAYAGTGNVLKVQELLALCGEHIETDEATAWKVGQTWQSTAFHHHAITIKLRACMWQCVALEWSVVLETS